MQNMNARMQKAIDSLEEEKKTLHIDLQRVSKDKDIQEMNLRWVYQGFVLKKVVFVEKTL